MAIDFPSSPSVNDTFTVGDAIYKWDGTVWTSTVSGAVDFLPVTGGTVTGVITASGGLVGDVTGNLDTGGVVITSSIISSGLGESIANLGDTVIGKYVFAGKKTNTGEKTIGTTLAGSNLRPVASDSGNTGSGTLSGTWRCQGYAGNNTGTNYNSKSATLWIRIV